MQSLRFVVRPASTPGLRAFSTATAATPAPTAPATSKHRSVVLSQYRWLLSTASQLARRPIARRHLIQFSPPNRMTLPMLEAADVYPSGRHYWSAAFFTKLKAISDRTVPTSPVRPFYGLEELNRLHNSRRAQDEPTDCSLQLTPARARYVLRSVFRHRMKEQDPTKLSQYISDGFTAGRRLSVLTGFPPYSYSEATTNGCRVSIVSFFVRSDAPDSHLFEYRVQIKNVTDELIKKTDAVGNTTLVPDTPRKFTLTSRKWLIHDARGGKPLTVEGPGVIGQTPTLQPGQTHRYASSCVLKTPIGWMTGEYTFVNTADPANNITTEPFTAQIAPFLLENREP